MRFFKDFFDGEHANERYKRLYRNRLGDIEAIEAGNVEAATSYFCKSRARLMQIAKFNTWDTRGADKEAQKVAIDMIMANPYAHLRTSIVFAWREIWSFGNNSPIEPAAGGLTSMFLNFICICSLLLMGILALLKGKFELLAFSMLPIGIFLFHALATHAIPRYSAPLIPIAIIAMLICIAALLRKIQTKLH